MANEEKKELSTEDLEQASGGKGDTCKIEGGNFDVGPTYAPPRHHEYHTNAPPRHHEYNTNEPPRHGEPPRHHGHHHRGW